MHVCGCWLCIVCIGGIVSTCPVCHAEVPMTRIDLSERHEGDYSGPIVVGFLFLLAGAVLWMAWLAS